MIESVLSNIIASVITSACLFALDKLRKRIGRASSKPYMPPKRYPRKAVKRQFYICMVTTPLFYGCALTAPDDYGFFAYAAAFISMFLEWCAFGAAFDFYPVDDLATDDVDKHTDSVSGNSGN